MGWFGEQAASNKDRKDQKSLCILSPFRSHFFWSSQQLGSAFLFCVILAMGWGGYGKGGYGWGFPPMMMMPWGKGKGKAGLY